MAAMCPGDSREEPLEESSSPHPGEHQSGSDHQSGDRATHRRRSRLKMEHTGPYDACV